MEIFTQKKSKKNKINYVLIKKLNIKIVIGLQNQSINQANKQIRFNPFTKKKDKKSKELKQFLFRLQFQVGRNYQAHTEHDNDERNDKTTAT